MKYLAILHGVNEGELEIECQPLRQLSTLPKCASYFVRKMDFRNGVLTQIQNQGNVYRLVLSSYF
jgi:hypothetical protein